MAFSRFASSAVRCLRSLTSESRKEKRRRRGSGYPLYQRTVETLAVLRFGQHHASVQLRAGRV
jgi:hypothetical protein